MIDSQTPQSGLKRIENSVQRICVAMMCLLACSCQSLNTVPSGQPSEIAQSPRRMAQQMPPQQLSQIPTATGYGHPTQQGFPSPQGFPVQQVAFNGPAALPPNAFTGGPAYGYNGVAGMHGPGCCPTGPGHAGVPTMYPPGWRPDGLECPWPADEYLFDGGDRKIGVEVMQDWTVMGLDQEDTVAHFDTLDGRTEVEPSNRVKIYAPRFASVRKVYGIKQHENKYRLAGVDTPLRLVQEEERSLATTVIQPIQPERYLVADTADVFRENTRGMGVSGALPVAGLRNRFKLFEDFQAIRQGIFDNSEKARMNLWLDAAEAWTTNQAVQVTIDNTVAIEASNDVELQSVYKYEMPDGKPRLRVIKVASKKMAQPGDEVEFTIRFDNIGDQIVGNVTIVDNLTTRLEYVPDSAQCDLEAAFITQENNGESLVLRWEIAEPLDVGKGGIIRFKCRVR